MTKFTRESIEKEIKRINSLIPKAFINRVYKEGMIAPTVVKVVDEAIADPNFDPEKKEQLIALKENGHFHKKKITEDPKVARQIDNIFNREIKKSVAAGRLPNKAQLAILQDQWKEEDKKNGSKK